VGVKRAIVHLYNSTSETQRRVVFHLDREGIKDIAVQGAKLIRECVEAAPDTEWIYQYSPRASPAPSSISRSTSPMRSVRCGSRRLSAR
jgi:isopropylmalate/homocitrate/citramalate synthase